MRGRIIHGDCLEVMPTLDAESVDAIVSDPPYGLAFMGKGWDHAVPGVEFWAAALRVAKPGAYLLAFGGTRTYHRLTCAIEDAGWEIHDCLSWLYGSGFPKHASKLKPAWEPIILARKPAPRATPLQVDACRIGDEVRVESFTSLAPCHGNRLGDAGTQEARRGTQGEPTTYTGRWPANVLLDEDAAAALDEQSGTSTSAGGGGIKAPGTHGIYGSFAGKEYGALGFGDTGGASRFFYTAKASRGERGTGNTHPTVKPLALMRWLCRLVSPPGGVVLDPFTGSGTTGVGAVVEGFQFVGIEREAEYVAIARARIAAAHEHPASLPLFAEPAA